MSTENHANNFGTQIGFAPQLNTKVDVPEAGETATYGIPVGYAMVAGTGLTDNGDGTFTVAETYASAPIEFVPLQGTSTEVSDSAGVAIDANTVDQATL